MAISPEQAQDQKRLEQPPWDYCRRLAQEMKAFPRKHRLAEFRAEVVVGRQVPGRRPGVDHLLVHLRVALGHQREQGRLRLGRDAVVLVDDLDAEADPVAPGDADVAVRAASMGLLPPSRRGDEGVSEKAQAR